MPSQKQLNQDRTSRGGDETETKTEDLRCSTRLVNTEAIVFAARGPGSPAESGLEALPILLPWLLPCWASAQSTQSGSETETSMG